MKPGTVAARLVLFEALPRGTPDRVLAGLPPPFAGGEISSHSVDLAALRDRQRDQVDAIDLIAHVPAPAAGEAVLALVGVDLFVPALSYVFGVSRLGQRQGLLSWHRLRVDQGRGPTLRESWLIIEAVHELGHTLGLVHCAVPHCAMHRTLWPEGIDLKRPEYCPTCARSAATLARG